MSFQDWLFGSEKTAPQDSAKDPKKDAKGSPSPEKSDPKKPDIPTPPTAGETAGEKKTTPEKPSPASEPRPAAAATAPPPEKPPKTSFIVSAKPGAKDESEHTQILTKAELQGFKSAVKETKPEAGKDSEKPATTESKSQDAKAKSAEKTDEKSAPEPSTEKAAAETPKLDDPQSSDPKKEVVSEPPPPKPATWKTEPVIESWCPPETAKEFPELDRHDYQDHVAIERIVSADWRVIGGSRRGRKQAFDHRFREDAMAFAALPNATVLCVSDGAGSSKYSRIGSHVGVHEVASLMAAEIASLETDKLDKPENLEKALTEKLKSCLEKARERIVAVADKSKIPAKEFRGTMLTVVHFKCDKGEWMLGNQIGDGAVCFLKKDGSVSKIASKDSGKFSGEVSCFFTDEEAKQRTGNIEVISKVDEIEAVFLCSDGIEDAFYPIDKLAEDIFRQWYTGVETPLKNFKTQPAQPAVVEQEAAAWALAQWLEFEKRGENDDRTVLLMHRRPVSVKFKATGP